MSSFIHFVTRVEQQLASLYDVECNNSCYNQNKSDSRVLAARTKARTKARSTFLLLIRNMEVRRYTVLCFVGVRTTYIGKRSFLRCCARSERPLGSCRRIIRLICATLAAMKSRELLAASCYIVQQAMKWLLSARLSLLPPSSSKQKLF